MIKKTTSSLLRSAMAGTLLLTAASVALAAPTTASSDVTRSPGRFIGTPVKKIEKAIKVVVDKGLRPETVTAAPNGNILIDATDAEGNPASFTYDAATKQLTQETGTQKFTPFSTNDTQNFSKQANAALTKAQEKGIKTAKKVIVGVNGTTTIIGATDSTGALLNVQTWSDGTAIVSPKA